MTVSSTIVVDFQDSAASSALVVVELDDTMNLDAAGEVKTEFYPGESVWFLVHHDATVRITGIRTTSGSVSGGGMVSREKTSQMLFKATDDEQEAGYIPSSVAAVWYGRSASIAVDYRTLTPSAAPVIGDVTIGYSTHQYCLTPPDITLTGDEKYYIGIVIDMESVA